MTNTSNTNSSTSTLLFSPETASQLSPNHVASLIPLKLTRDNYLLWKDILTLVLQNYGMFTLVDGSDLSPSPLIGTTVNPAYTSWVQRDRTCRIWITASLSESILPYTVGTTTARSLWLTLERRLAALTRSHVLQLRPRIQTLRKGSLSITEYLQRTKAISDALAAAGESLNESDLVAHILHGLPPEYEAFTTSIRVRAEPVTSDELHGLLLSQEVELEVQSASHDLAQPLPPAQAFAVSSSNLPRFPPRGPNHNFRPQTFPRPRFPNPSAQFRTAFPNSNPPLLPNPSYPSLQQNSNPNRPRPRCQICGLANHRALDCFNRWNHAYQGRVPPALLAAMAAPSRRAMPTANFTPTSSATPFNHSAPSDSLWYIDSGATNHITSDLSNLNLSDPYNGPDQVSVASGQGSSVGEGSVSQSY